MIVLYDGMSMTYSDENIIKSHGPVEKNKQFRGVDRWKKMRPYISFPQNNFIRNGLIAFAGVSPNIFESETPPHSTSKSPLQPDVQCTPRRYMRLSSCTTLLPIDMSLLMV